MAGSHEQKALMQLWEEHTGFEFIGKDCVKANDPQGFMDMWKRNARWLMDVAAEAESFIDAYSERYGG